MASEINTNAMRELASLHGYHELRNYADEIDALRDRVAKLLALHEVWRQLWSVDSPIRWSDLEAAAKAAGVQL